MVAVLDSPPPMSSFRSTSLRTRLKMEETALEQAFKETANRDYEPEWSSDSCSEDSYSSSADYSCSSGTSPGLALTLSTLRLGTGPPQVQNSCIHVMTPTNQVTDSTTLYSPIRSKLTQLLHKHASVVSTATRAAEAENARSSARFLQIAWQMFPRNFPIRFALRGSATSDTSTKEDGKSDVGEFMVDESHGVLEALSETGYDKTRVRECRMNQDFLRIYALDYSARASGALLPSTEECEGSPRPLSEIVGLFSHNEEEQDPEDERLRLSQLSQEKLWKCVMLSPRTDPVPCRMIDPSHYVRDYETRAARPRRIDLPKGGMKPAGQLRRSQCLQSPSCPYSGCTVPQYTLKGWHNRRWTAVQ